MIFSILVILFVVLQLIFDYFCVKRLFQLELKKQNTDEIFSENGKATMFVLKNKYSKKKR